MTLPPLPVFAALMLLAACGGSTPPAPVLPSFMAAEIETDAQGRCYGRDITPAVIETVTEQALVRPQSAATATAAAQPAAYTRVTRQVIVRERREVAFETLCPPSFTQDFVETLQRALVARGFHQGPVTGRLDQATLDAVQAFQRDDGPDSPLLSISAARRLGIVALSPQQIEAMNRR